MERESKSTLVVIPARYASTRFPGKPLAPIAGKPMIRHVYERAASAASVDAVIVATDDARIRDAVEGFGGRAVMTNPDAASGTERVAEVARAHAANVIVNVQGDEPLIHPEMIDQVAEFLQAHGAVPMASLMRPIRDPALLQNPNVVKVVTDREGFALYFSRSAVPYKRSEHGATPYQHVGLYGYQRSFLLRYTALEPSPLERSEQLEQLRALEHGYRIKLLETSHAAIGVDAPEDVARVEAFLRKD